MEIPISTFPRPQLQLPPFISRFCFGIVCEILVSGFHSSGLFFSPSPLFILQEFLPSQKRANVIMVACNVKYLTTVSGFCIKLRNVLEKELHQAVRRSWGHKSNEKKKTGRKLSFSRGGATFVKSFASGQLHHHLTLGGRHLSWMRIAVSCSVRHLYFTLAWLQFKVTLIAA